MARKRGKIMRVCNACGALSEESLCPAHRRQPWRDWRTDGRLRGKQKTERNRRVMRRYGHRCYLCGGTATEVDHRMPLAQNGPDDESNLRPICTECHRKKTQAEAQAGRSNPAE